MMGESTTGHAQSASPAGKKVVEEAASLLRLMRFSTNHGAYAEGQSVAVSIDRRWNEDEETIQVLITCYAFGRRRVDWQGLPVFVLPETAQRSGWIAFLNAAGETFLPNLPPGDYRLAVSQQYRRSHDTVLQPTQPQALAAQPANRKSGVPETHIYETADGRVRGTVRQTSADTTVVAFETNDEAFAGATVRFAFVQASGQEAYSTEVTLKPVESEDGLWEGRWEATIEISEPCELVFAVLPKES